MLERRRYRPPRFPIADLSRHTHPYVTPGQLAEWWGVSPDTVVRWTVDGYRQRSDPRCMPRVFLRGTLHGAAPGRMPREWVYLVADVLRFEREAGFEIRRMPVPICRTKPSNYLQAGG